MKKTTLAIAAALTAAAVLSGCAAEEPRHPESSHGLAYENELDGSGTETGEAKFTVTVPMKSFSVVIPAEIVLDEYGTGTDTLYEDGCVGTRTLTASSSDGEITFSFSEVSGRDFGVVGSWATGLPDSATDPKSAKTFGMGEDVAGAAWDEPVFYDAAGGDGIAVSYVLDGTRTTVHFVDLGESGYAEVRGTFPDAAYADDPGYFEYVFNSIATNEWMSSWTGREQGA